MLGGRFTALFFVWLCVALPAQSIAAWFSPKGCEFKVEFPGKPEISQQYLEGAGYIEQATGGRRGNTEDSLALKADWAPYDPAALAGVDREQYLLNAARAYANFNGLSNAEYKFSESNLGHEVTLRGGKTVGGVQVLYMGKVVMGRTSILMLYGGGAASSFPQPGLLEFMASVRLQ